MASVTEASPLLRDAIHRALAEYEAIDKENPAPLIAVFDDNAGRYALVSYGFDGDEYGSHCVVFIEIKHDKIWIQSDHLEKGIAADLVREGISKDQIVLGFREPHLRPYTGFAVE
jgi:hypothetical protein